MPGSEPVFAIQAKNRGWFQWVSAGSDELVQIPQHRLEGLGLLRRLGGQSRPQLARCDRCGDGQPVDAGEIVLDPGGRAREIVSEGRQRFFFNFSICFHVRVFSTSSFVSHARRACPTPSST